MAFEEPRRRTFIKMSAAGTAGLTLAGAWPLASTAEAQAAAAAAGPVALRFRQVHLDFHTSEDVPGVGNQFDPQEFADTLVKARVNSVTCFARCHHGYIYYDTKLNPERRHPHLKRNLLKEQIEACHARDIRVPIYSTVQWDRFTADHHPEWRVRTATGALEGTPPFEPGFRQQLCLNSPFVGFLKAHVREIVDSVPTDGLFLDIVKTQDCACRHCLKEMEERKLDASIEAVRQKFGVEVTRRFISDMSAYIRTLDPDCTIFYNSGHVDPSIRPVIAAYTHVEIESLPSGAWGYLHFPLTVRYARNLGPDFLGMTGKFHTSWGDFHSYKNRAALEFECFHMLAHTAKCSVGDQLHPSGKIDGPTYDLIGAVYAQVEKKEPWCSGARPVVDLGVFSPEEFVVGRNNPTAMGVTRLLQEGRHQFDFVDSESDLARYKVLVLPDEILVGPALLDKLRAYLEGGGALLASYRSGLNPAKEAFVLDALGVGLKGKAPFSPDFIRPGRAIGAGLPAVEHVMYLEGLEVETRAGSEVLAEAVVPYFNRTWEHFLSHRHTPSSGKVGYPAIVRKGKAIYFAHPVFTQYNRNAPYWCKRLVLNALDLLLPDPLLRVEAPSTAIATLNEQSREKRRVLHLLHYVPERRGEFDVIEDVIPIANVRCSVRADGGRVSKVLTAPEGKDLPFTTRGGRIEFVVPEVRGHQMIAIEERVAYSRWNS
jgi:hypothetical protein